MFRILLSLLAARRKSSRSFFCLPALVLLVLLCPLPAATRKPVAPPQPSAPVVAIADVHGDFDAFVAILRHIGLIDPQNQWIASNTIFVQVGDLLDRGPKPREVLDLIMALEPEAHSAGGRVVPLLGNHEMMNIMGDLRYVTPANFATFSGSDSAERQKTAFARYAKWREAHSALLAELPQPMEMTEAEWMARHPAGFLEQREAFAPQGKYGAWLRQHDAVTQIDGVIFLHGGISPDLSHTSVEAINKRIREEISAFDSATQYLQKEDLLLPFFTFQEIAAVLQAEILAERKSRVPVNEARQAKILEFLKLQEWLSVRVDGPLWFRGYDQWTDEQGAPLAAKVLDAYKAHHLVVGHTVQKGGRIRPRFANKIFLIDTGMLSSYYPGGRASALEICGGARFTAVYLDQQLLLEPSGGSAPAPTPAAQSSAAAPAAASEKLAIPPIANVCSPTVAAPQ